MSHLQDKTICVRLAEKEYISLTLCKCKAIKLEEVRNEFIKSSNNSPLGRKVKKTVAVAMPVSQGPEDWRQQVDKCFSELEARMMEALRKTICQPIMSEQEQRPHQTARRRGPSRCFRCHLTDHLI